MCDCIVIDPVSTNRSVLHQLIENAWKAIEHGDISSLKQAIHELKELSPITLNTHRLTKGNGVLYCMSLLAFCGFHRRQDMVDLLLKEGADMNASHTCSIHGAPVSQMMVHCLIQHQYDKLDVTMLQYFFKNGAVPHGEINTGHEDLGGSGVSYGLLDTPLAMNRVDCAIVLVAAGVDPINGGSPRGEEFDVVPMFQEYCDHGANKFIRWVLNEYLLQHPEVDLNKFAHRLIRSIINMNKQNELNNWWSSQRRSPAHAVLTCGNREMIKLLVLSGKDEGLDLLAERSATGRTALHIAARNDDEDSADVLLQLGADTRVYDNSDRNPFMLAVEKGQLKVAKLMIEKDPGLVSLQLGSGVTVIHWALDRGLDTFFKCFKPEDRLQLLRAQDSDGSSIAHLVASSGNAEVFKTLWSKELTVEIFRANDEDKTPLQLAVEHGHVNILNAFKECVDGGREGTTPNWHMSFRKDWWTKMIPYFLYACSCGSLNVVKYFVAKGYQPNASLQGKTPLLCAATSGHEEIVVYLLQFTQVLSDLKEQATVNASESPLLAASQKGHTKCVTRLLRKGGNVLQTDHIGRNCLIIAIQNHHEDTALAILSEEKVGLKALEIRYEEKLTPLRLLIKEMPELAEFVLNRCVTQTSDGLGRQLSIEGDDVIDYRPIGAGGPAVEYNYAYLEDIAVKQDAKGQVLRQESFLGNDATDGRVDQGDLESGRRVSPQSNDNHILKWMIKYKRLDLLQHPLVKNYLFHKFWLVTFPIYLVYLLFYCTFLIFLNSFALLSPRPGPESETCPITAMSNISNGTGSACLGQSGVDRSYLAAAAVLLYLLSLAGLGIEIVQMVQRCRNCQYLRELDNYFQLSLYLLTIIFVSGFGNDCWCAPSWQWQIGAFAVFLAWFNFILILKDMPCTAIPINMFISICITFLKLVFLPVLLVLSFGIPFYMVFVRTASSYEGDNPPGGLVAFSSPAHAIAKALFQVAGEIDYENIVNQGDLLYNPTTYILFIIFLVTMPVLFANLLIGLAVGDTQEVKKKAEFTKFQVRVEFILERERNSRLIRTCSKTTSKYDPSDEMFADSEEHQWWSSNRCTRFLVRLLGSEYNRHKKVAKRLKERNDNIYKQVMEHNPVDAMKEEVAELKEEIGDIKQEIASFQNEVKVSLKELMDSMQHLTSKLEGMSR